MTNTKYKFTFPNLSIEKASQIWCRSNLSDRTMDTELCTAVAEEIDKALSDPSLGCATTEQIIEELKARSDLKYRSVDS